MKISIPPVLLSVLAIVLTLALLVLCRVGAKGLAISLLAYLGFRRAQRLSTSPVGTAPIPDCSEQGEAQDA
jgi:hypothetical protein